MTHDIVVFGMDSDDQVEDFLSSFSKVKVTVERPDPNAMHAVGAEAVVIVLSSEAARTFILGAIVAASSIVVSGALQEAGKELYLATKSFIKRRYQRWRDGDPDVQWQGQRVSFAPLDREEKEGHGWIRMQFITSLSATAVLRRDGNVGLCVDEIFSVFESSISPVLKEITEHYPTANATIGFDSDIKDEVVELKMRVLLKIQHKGLAVLDFDQFGNVKNLTNTSNKALHQEINDFILQHCVKLPSEGS